MARPTIMTDSLVTKLEEAFSKGCSVTEACLLCDISRNTYYEYLKDNPEFNDKVEMLKENITLHARMNLAASVLSGDLADSRWYLERKKKDEFSTSSNYNIGGQSDNPIEVNINTKDMEILKNAGFIK
jgi:ACT domain-containing protein